ncbi:MAG: lysylphosphatidylglycerol synthase domain-containing protein, partial [Anaerolineae bacterium]|nr:lysylphosphatidylglycerol synthase domain-containing protein [Anaerolineae bacterium]
MKRRWLLWALAGVLLVVVLTRLAELEQLAATLSQGRWPWVLAAALLQLGYYLAFAALYRAAFSAVGVSTRLLDLVPVVFGSLALTVALPSGGLSAAALFVDDAARRGQSALRAAAGVLLVQVAQLGVFALILLAALLHLGVSRSLQGYHLAASALLLLFLGGMLGLLLLGAWHPAILRRALAAAQRLADRLGGLLGRR